MSNIASPQDQGACLECGDVFLPTGVHQPLQKSGCLSCNILREFPAVAKSRRSSDPSEVPCSVCHDLLVPDALRFPYTYREVRSSAESCISCELLQKLAEHAEPDETTRESAIITLQIKFGISGVDRSRFFINLKNQQVNKNKRLEVYSHEPTRWYNIPVVPPEAIPTDIVDSFERAATWVNECSLKHPLCLANRTSFPTMPKRILHVKYESDSLDAKLFITNGKNAPYFALSHRWGKNAPPWITTTKNIAEHLGGIPLTNLSKLLFQAMLYTTLIGLEYIWIDSLCIIQDDLMDWEQEASSMTSVYANAFITLAAAGHQDLFSGIAPKQIKINLRARQGEITCPTIFAREPINHITQRPDRQGDQFQLLKRAWVYQERLLSQRVLYFGPNELFWECVEGMKCECCYLDASTGSKINIDPGLNVNLKRKHTAALRAGNAKELVARNYPQNEELIKATSTSTKRPQVLEAWWRELVTGYSGLDLTYQKDRLVALSGLAKEMQSYRGSRYLAGLWEDSLFRDLLWQASWLGYSPKRQRDWQAPSWSWASQVGTVRYTNDQLVKLPGVHVHFTSGILENPGDVSSPLKGLSCELVEAECTPAGDDETGRLLSGSIKVYGHVIDGINLRSSIMTTDDGSRKLVINEQPSFELSFDEEFSDESEEEVFLSQSFCLLRIGCITEHWSTRLFEWSLLLQRLERDGVKFLRCGIVGVLVEGPACEDSPWYRRVHKKKLVTII